MNFFPHVGVELVDRYMLTHELGQDEGQQFAFGYQSQQVGVLPPQIIALVRQAAETTS